MLTVMEPFTSEAIAVLTQAMGHAHRLGHRYIGGEHLLLAVVSASQPAAVVLRDYGVTPERVTEEIVRQIGLGAGACSAALTGTHERSSGLIWTT